jgi:hypothetical protein
MSARVGPAPRMTAEDLRRIFRHRRRRRSSIDKERERVDTVLGLIEMRRAGLLRAVYCDAGRLELVYDDLYALPVRRSVRWSEAARAVAEFRRIGRPGVNAEFRAT